MNNTVVIYESKYGSTKSYAQWIAEELSCPLFERKKFNPKDFEKYEVIIYGGGLDVYKRQSLVWRRFIF